MKPNVSVSIEAALRKLVPLTGRIEAALDAGAAAAHGVMQIYPPPPPASRYRRTGNLRQKLRIRKLSRTARVVENTASYARFVYGMPQARVHRRRWASVEDASEKAREEIIRELRRR